MTPFADSRRCPLLVFVVVLATYLVLVFMHGRLFNIDEVFYKAAGGNWAVLGRFAAPELTGRLPFDPPIEKVFACYPPLYPISFGLYARAFGFGYTQLCLFDALIRVALCVVTACTALRIGAAMARRERATVTAGAVCKQTTCGSTALNWPAVLAGLFVMPLGAIGRPDDLAIIFGMLACARLLATEGRERYWHVGVLLGLAAATSLVAAGVFAVVASGLVWTASGSSLRRRCLGIGVMAWVSATVLAAAFVPLLMIDAHAWRQLLDHGADNLRVGGIVGSWRKDWLEGQYVMMASLGVFVGSCLLLGWAWRAGQVEKWLRWFPAALGMIVLIVIKTDGKYYYLWFAGPWLVAAVSSLLALGWRERWARGWGIVVGIVVLAGGLYGAQFWVVERLVVARIPSEQRFEAASARIKAVVPPGEPVIASEHWVTFLGRNPVHELTIGITPKDRDAVRYIVLTGNGSREPGRAQRHPTAMQAYADEHFQKIDDHLAREPLRLFGVRITNSAYGWDAAIFERR